eukprot:CAMPEP_0183566880 /NCGR_PEP_ID=MMETSP0371-20130417/112969_1 /TAXON_ID=268820 /ORGANISM="Peridinium aciculiferum, Strain PAER-2" /LENGTH=53 /DNA_ID=CAMNT_0025776209 /DNA_START=182 /DNA_END=343 /DNA_ORIENTATION=-
MAAATSAYQHSVSTALKPSVLRGGRWAHFDGSNARRRCSRGGVRLHRHVADEH